MDVQDIKMARILVHQTSKPLEDISQKVHAEMEKIRPLIHSEMRICIACGSRGISNLSIIVRSMVDCLHEFGASPFIVPAMGSHGGATPEGQAQVLKDYGICEDTMGVPVLSSLEVVSLGSTGGDPDIPVYMDKFAWESDGVIVVNRVKCHTDFQGEHESGIVKMLTIGLGKHRQAIITHRYGARGLRDQIPRISQKVLDSGKILGGMAILEDGCDQTSDLCFTRPDIFFDTDARFLKKSKSMAAHIPFKNLHVLIVDQMGKNFSGTGLDTNVIGRMRINGEPELPPVCRRLMVCDISDESHGNALGVGLADIISRRLQEKINWDATYANILTSGFLERGFLPIVAPTDQSALDIALRTCGIFTADTLRIARIPNTLHLEQFLVTKPILDELRSSTDVSWEQLSDLETLSFDESGSFFPII